jgi:hypothetical protein
MSDDFTVQPVTLIRAGGDSGPESRAASVQTPRQPELAGRALPVANPTLRLDPALGLVVIEFHNDSSGAVTTSIPSQRQLEAYQRWDATHFGPTPAGQPGAVPESTKDDGRE